jgi:hypothetical protein
MKFDPLDAGRPGRERGRDPLQSVFASERQVTWQQLTEGRPPEWVAGYRASPTACWQVVVQDGPPQDRQRYVACLDAEEDLPHWAMALARAYLDDVGEWPLFGMYAELALEEYEDHGDVSRAVREILHAVHAVWPDVTVVEIGYVPLQ